MSIPHRGLEPSLSQLINHPIFEGTPASEATLTDNTNETQGLHSLLCVRDSDIIVAMGTELRMMPLSTQSAPAYKVRLTIYQVAWLSSKVASGPFSTQLHDKTDFS
jgi:hypothetical protein